MGQEAGRPPHRRSPACPIACYHGGLARGARDQLIAEFQAREGAGALVLSLKAGGTGLNLTAASHVVLYDRWWNPAVEDQARDRAWRIGQTRTVVSHRLVCPGTVDERVEEVVAGKRHIADLVLPKSSSLADLDAEQLRVALGLRTDALLTEEDDLHEAAQHRPGASSGRRRPAASKRASRARPVAAGAAAAGTGADRAGRRPHALLRSLGDPPLPGQGAAAEHDLAPWCRAGRRVRHGARGLRRPARADPTPTSRPDRRAAS